MKANKKTKNAEGKVPAVAVKTENCGDKKCNIHGNLKARGRIFEGIITRKFPKRITLEFERMVYVKKYERYKKSRT
ncbi:MAG: hypothetical protein AABX28_00370, partial [Nanoarchaeota archaeon]